MAGGIAARKKFEKIHIEISNICNLQCDFCPTVEREKEIMPESLFRSLVQQAQPLTRHICLHLMGEPLGHPQFPHYVDICAEYNAPVNLTTNATLLNSANRTALLNPIIEQINFSLHSFAANFPTQDPSAYLQKVFSFVDEALAKRPELYLNFRLWSLRDNSAQTQANQKILAAICSHYQFSFDDQIDVRKKKSFPIKGRLYLHFDTRFDWPSMQDPIRSERGFCYGLNTHFGIHADGTVVPCCLDKEADLAVGDASRESLESILESERARNIMQGFASFQLREELCQKCTYIKRFDQKVFRSTTKAASKVATAALSKS
jgi:radical SAM protein with 4Fe4S-binding SPASM domain